MVKKLRAVSHQKERDFGKKELARLARKKTNREFFHPESRARVPSTKRKRNAKDAHNVLAFASV